MPKQWDPRQTKRNPSRKPENRAPRDKSRFAPKPKPVRPPIGEGVAILYGWHTVAAALANPKRTVRKITATENAARRLTEEGLTLPVTPEIVRPEAIAARLSPDSVHQGLLVEADPLPSPDLEDLEAAGTVLVLDQITDPHNVGAILRTAAAFAVKAVITTARHSPEATGVLAKSASGALDLIPIVAVQNLARALDALKERGFLTVGLDSDGETDLSQAALREPLALVLGAEGKGLRQLTAQTCDIRARLDLPGAIKSLNVSNAAAVALYAAAAVLTART
jgi:23S rRNA (guanosine2251-2'-O)-methyltransferase